MSLGHVLTYLENEIELLEKTLPEGQADTITALKFLRQYLVGTYCSHLEQDILNTEYPI